MKYLIVDDSRAMRSYVRGVLGTEHTMMEVSSGFEALRLLPREHFDLVITDINMPDINGFELVRFIRSSEKLSKVPVLVISTQASTREQQRIKEVGADFFLAKPFEPSELSEAVNSLLNNGTGES